MTTFKTLQNCKDEVAQRCTQYPNSSNPYYKDWPSMVDSLLDKDEVIVLLLRLEEAAELYANQYKDLLAEKEKEHQNKIIELLLQDKTEQRIQMYQNALEDRERELEEAKTVVGQYDKELDIVHQCLTELYNYDNITPIIQKCLKEIEKLNP